MFSSVLGSGLGLACHDADVVDGPFGSGGLGGSAGGSSAGGPTAVGGLAVVSSGGEASGARPGAGGANSVNTGGTELGPGGASHGTGGAHADGGDGVGGTAFEGGTRLVIPKVETPLVISLSGTVGADEPVAPVLEILDGPDLAREHKLSFSLPYVLSNSSQCTLAIEGHLEIENVAVTQDVGHTGAHLSLEEGEGGYILRHDGIGKHTLDLTGAFRPDDPTRCPDLFDKTDLLPVEVRSEVRVQSLASVKMVLDPSCEAQPRALSGMAFPNVRLALFNSEGDEIFPGNVNRGFPIDVVVDTEKTAEITPPKSFTTENVIVEGPPQLVRLSTRFGIFLSYELLDDAQVDDWDVQYWTSGTHATHVAIESGGTFQGGTGTALSIGADARLISGQVPLCSVSPVERFVTSAVTGECFPNSPGTEVLVGFVGGTGMCSLEYSYPAARNGQGVTSALSVTFVE